MPTPKHAIPLRLALALALASGACRSTEPDTPGSARAQPEALGPAPDPEPAPQPPDPERADKLRDLDDMCKAVDHDYGDGTLGDYYRGLEPRTAWGQAQLAAGNESITPGRLLERAVAELDPGAKDPILEHCRVLLDYLDDVE